jgi:hypothetical protein
MTEGLPLAGGMGIEEEFGPLWPTSGTGRTSTGAGVFQLSSSPLGLGASVAAEAMMNSHWYDRANNVISVCRLEI